MTILQHTRPPVRSKVRAMAQRTYTRRLRLVSTVRPSCGSSDSRGEGAGAVMGYSLALCAARIFVRALAAS